MAQSQFLRKFVHILQDMIDLLLGLVYRMLLIPFFIGSLIQKIITYPISLLVSFIRVFFKLVRGVYTRLVLRIVSALYALKKSLKRAKRRIRLAYKRFKKCLAVARGYIAGLSYYFKVAA